MPQTKSASLKTQISVWSKCHLCPGWSLFRSLEILLWFCSSIWGHWPLESRIPLHLLFSWPSAKRATRLTNKHGVERRDMKRRIKMMQWKQASWNQLFKPLLDGEDSFVCVHQHAREDKIYFIYERMNYYIQYLYWAVPVSMRPYFIFQGLLSDTVTQAPWMLLTMSIFVPTGP